MKDLIAVAIVCLWLGILSLQLGVISMKPKKEVEQIEQKVDSIKTQYKDSTLIITKEINERLISLENLFKTAEQLEKEYGE